MLFVKLSRLLTSIKKMMINSCICSCTFKSKCIHCKIIIKQGSGTEVIEGKYLCDPCYRKSPLFLNRRLTRTITPFD